MRTPTDVSTHPLFEVATQESREGVGEAILKFDTVTLETKDLLTLLTIAWVRGYDYKPTN